MAGKYRLAALALAAALVCAGCQPTPETSAVTSKNDGALEAAIQISAEDNITEAASGGGSYSDSFTSADGSAAYTVELELPAAGALPVLLAEPEPFGSDTAENIARALFGDAELYDYNDKMTKDDISDHILSLRQSISELEEDEFGEEDEYYEMIVSDIESYIAQYEAMYDSAPETVERTLCDFTFHGSDYYYPTSVDLYGEDSSEAAFIVAETEIDGLSYEFLVTNDETEDGYRDYSVIVMEKGYLEGTGDSGLYDAAAADEPTEEEAAAIAARAEEMIAAMDVGDWSVESWRVSRVSGDGENFYWEVVVDALPVYNGLVVTVPAETFSAAEPEIFSEQSVSAPTGLDAVYAPVYQDETMQFRFVGGELVWYEYYGPLTVTETANENVQTLSFDEVADCLRTQMRLYGADYYTGNYLYSSYCDPLTVNFPEGTRAEATVDSVALRLARIDVQDAEGEYYLVPAYTFYGSIAMYDDAGNQLPYVYGSETTEGSMYVELCTINAVDGSIISASLGY